MTKKSTVYIKDSATHKPIEITDEYKPNIDQKVLDKWQNITNILAQLMDAKASLVNRLDEEYLEIFMMSQNKSNPYTIGLCDPVGHGAYCEQVVGKKQKLMVVNAKEDDVWKDSLYVKYNFVSYFGLPINWPDGQVFGTLCVIDNKVNEFDSKFQSIFQEFKSSMEKDLELLVQKDELRKAAELDGLTSVYNRRKLDDLLEKEYLRSQRTGQVFSVIILDLDHFKVINDSFGHQKGDEVIIRFSHTIKNRIRKTDTFGRLGGDEFLIICPDTDFKGAEDLIHSIKETVIESMEAFIDNFGFSYGIAAYEEDQMFEHILKRADDHLYKMKAEKKATEK